MSETISHGTTQDITVWAPAEDGEWPVIYAMHGTVQMGASRHDWDAMGQRLAAQGHVVFAADNRQSTFDETVQDGECAYRYALGVAEDYGGDINQPVTFVGHSFGAWLVLGGGLDETFGPDGAYSVCFDGVPRPEVIVSIAGCYYTGPAGQPIPLDTSSWTSQADIVLVGLENDEICDPQDSARLAEQLRAEGHESVEHIEVAGADHFSPLFGTLEGDEWITIPDSENGEKLTAIVAARIEAARA